MSKVYKVYTVTIRKQFPSWDETDGIVYRGIVGVSKREAVETIRARGYNHGHIGQGQGRYWITAVESDDLPETDTDY